MHKNYLIIILFLQNYCNLKSILSKGAKRFKAMFNKPFTKRTEPLSSHNQL